jgi:hypothetical protein
MVLLGAGSSFFPLAERFDDMRQKHSSFSHTSTFLVTKSLAMNRNSYGNFPYWYVGQRGVI